VLLYTIGVKQMLSAKLKLHTSPAQFQALRRTSLAYRDGLNALSHYAYAHGKTSSNQALHRGMYAQLRATYHLPSQLACSVERQVAATYKGVWTKVNQHKKRLQQKGTRNATRRLRRIAQRERRLKQQANHVVSKHIVTTHPRALIGLEQLTDIRERSKRRRRGASREGFGNESVSAKALRLLR
jgi:hypothetical protein